MKYKPEALASILPQWFLVQMACWFDDPESFECSDLGESFWMDASYHKWARVDSRKDHDDDAV